MTGAPDKDLIAMLTTKRPAWSLTEEAFIEKWLAPLPGFYQDDFGNVLIQVGDSPTIMWSSHTDTVHHKDGTQELKIEGPFIEAVCGAKREKSNCLGADCGAGIWLMVKMIEAGIPGLYIFHRDEESGGKGSAWIAKNTPHVVEGIDFAIAFDRKDYTSIITHQRGIRCCSDDFADSLATLLGNNFKRDATGVFTDTANYTDLIGECTNISVGYFSQHGPAEKQNWVFLSMLLDTLLKADYGTLIAMREPGEPDPDYNPYYNPKGWNGDYSIYSREPSEMSMEDYVYTKYGAVARYLTWLGFTVEDIENFRKENPANVHQSSALYLSGPK